MQYSESWSQMFKILLYKILNFYDSFMSLSEILPPFGIVNFNSDKTWKHKRISFVSSM